MKSKPETPRDIDEYIAGFPDDIQALLQEIRATIQKVIIYLTDQPNVGDLRG